MPIPDRLKAILSDKFFFERTKFFIDSVARILYYYAQIQLYKKQQRQLRK